MVDLFCFQKLAFSMKYFVSALLIVATLLLVGTSSMEDYLIESSSTSWFVGHLFPRITFLSVLIALAFGISRNFALKPILRVLIFIVVVGSGTGLYLFKNKPFKVDWNKYGSHLTEDPDAEPFERYFEETRPNFEGLACLALTGCDYCHNMIDDLITMKIRKPELEVAIFLFAIDSSEIQLVKSQIGDVDISVQNAPEPGVSFRITSGNFPTILYIKQGKASHRWYYNEFGHPAKDLVESEKL
ncbi:MAG: hypothetical protein ACI85F_001230 [Bacteroidia bacterium]|jgi:hypothetical protein